MTDRPRLQPEHNPLDRAGHVATGAAVVIATPLVISGVLSMLAR